MARGRQFKPGNKFGRGRPKGAKNKATLFLSQTLNDSDFDWVGDLAAAFREGDEKRLAMYERWARYLFAEVKIAELQIKPYTPAQSVENADDIKKMRISRLEEQTAPAPTAGS